MRNALPLPASLEHVCQYRNYYNTVRPLMFAISPRLGRALLADNNIDSADLFIWSVSFRQPVHPSPASAILHMHNNLAPQVISGYFDLAKFFWQKTKHPLAMAMFGSYVCRHDGHTQHVCTMAMLRMYACNPTSSGT